MLWTDGILVIDLVPKTGFFKVYIEFHDLLLR